MLIGEAPGAEEDKDGRPFVGKAGRELDNYLINAGLRRENCYITNIVKCRPPGNRDPKPDEIAACRVHLRNEISNSTAEVLAPLGRLALEEILGRSDIAMVHGIPQEPERLANVLSECTIVPCYHPAAGLHNTTMMTNLLQDFRAVRQTLDGTIKYTDWDDLIEPEYFSGIPNTIPDDGLLAVDTESVNGKLHSIQVCWEPGTAKMFTMGLSLLKDALEAHILILHNAQHDLQQLAQVGIYPKRWWDTMLMANLLQDLPRGLKALAYRLCGMKMRDYQDVVSPYTQIRCLEWVERAKAISWPKQVGSQSLNTLLKRATTDYNKNPGLDLLKRITSWADYGLASELIGPLEEATIADVDPEEATFYGCQDADATMRIFPILKARIEAEGLMQALEIDQRAVPMVMQMEQTGMGLDEQHIIELGAGYAAEREKVSLDIQAEVGYNINVGSPEQVSELLFDRLGLPPGKKTKGGKHYTTDDDILKLLKDRHPLVPKIIKYREMQIMEKNFVEGVLENYYRSGDGRVHPELSMISVVTGRFASYNPNLLAFPAPTHSAEGGPLRDSFVAGEGHSFVSFDYSQIELRLMAHLSQEPAMLAIFNAGGDIHRDIAGEVFRKPPHLITDEERFEAKTVNFGIPYGMTAKKLYEAVGPRGRTLEWCAEFIESWLNRFSKIRDMMADFHQQARRYQFVRDLTGRKRLVPEVRSCHYWIREAGLRQAGNAPIQMGAGSIMKEAMGNLYDVVALFHGMFYCKALLQIHDDLLFEIGDGGLYMAVPFIKGIMEKSMELSIPTPVDVKCGKRWGSMHGREK
jgi:uracil-DNA glycosylase family 4